MAACASLVFLLTGCSSQSFASRIMRKADKAPAPIIAKPGVELEDTACISPLVDPNDGTEIIMIESFKGVGDYMAPQGKYRVKKNELLRLDYQTGEVLGIVRK